MKLGEKLRQLRNEKQLTQPDLAEALGIEQSYLSKLENDKSLPSNDVLNRILDVFELDIADLVDALDQGSKNQMRHIPDVADHLRRQKQMIIGSQKRWLLLSSLMFALGVALIYAGTVHMFFSDTVYQYISHGVVLEGEPKEIFRNPQLSVTELANHEERKAKSDAIRARTNEDFILSSDFRGSVFNVEIEGGSRTYYLQKETQVDPWQNKLVTFFGVLLAMFGLTGIALDRKLSRFG